MTYSQAHMHTKVFGVQFWIIIGKTPNYTEKS